VADRAAFVPDGFVVPLLLAHERFRLEPLGPQHNESDHVAWSSSIAHIRTTAGFAAGDWDGDAWPYPMHAADNLHDLEMHAAEFTRREAFAYTVLEPEGERVIGCVYLDPDETGLAACKVRCWVSVDRAPLDAELAGAVRSWLAAEWPFASVRFPGR